MSESRWANRGRKDVRGFFRNKTQPTELKVTSNVRFYADTFDGGYAKALADCKQLIYKEYGLSPDSSLWNKLKGEE